MVQLVTSGLGANKLKTVTNYIEAAKLAVNVRENEQKTAFQKLNNESEKVFPTFLENLSTSEAADVLRFLIQLNPQSDLIDEVQRILNEAKDFDCVDFNTLLKILRYSNNVYLDQNILRKVRNSVLTRAQNELDKPQDLISLVHYDTKSAWLQNANFVKTAEKLVDVMGPGEKIAFLKIMGEKNQRNVLLIRKISAAVSRSSQCLTIAQIQNIVQSLVGLSYFSPPIMKKINEDLPKHSNVLQKWNDVVSISDSLLRLRMGNEKTWSFLSRWATQNAKEASVDQLTRFVSILSKIGVPIEVGKPLAEVLKPLLNREKLRHPVAWLNIIHSLAYFQQLDANLADSVLNKDFVENLLTSSLEKHDRLRKALILLSINGCAVNELENYNGPTISKSSLEKYGILFNSDSIREARQLKYTKNTKECDEFLAKLFQIAPRDKYCKHSDIEEFGTFVDAYVMPEKETGRVVAVEKWNTNPRPIFFYGWQQVKQDVENPENVLMGSAQLDLRLAKKRGFSPIVVFKTDFDYCATDIDKLNMLRNKIHG
ncbi:unnamed protein product [Caenorhabditis angaria]|uniref:FAST kinase leucine-rich domain-containing protein n=1 Tax=Caenorhabditis angaria TaxID=860376 RepID=A0A9P1N2Q6_9PELO|nr:unnamed protein product [Caenorhabditis angaria]